MTGLLRAGALLAVLGAAACGGSPGPHGGAASQKDDRAEVTLVRVGARAAAAETGPVVATLVRGTAVRLVGAEGDFVKVAPPSGAEVWIPAASVERASDRAAREARARSVARFEALPARAVEPCPIFLAPDYGAARWGQLDDGDDVEVLLAEPDFYGVRLGSEGLAFVPARSIRLLPAPPAPVPPSGEVSQGGGGDGVPELREEGALTPAPPATMPETTGVTPGPTQAAATSGAPAGPLESLPAGSEAPVLVSRVDPRYPEAARRGRVAGDVVLKILVEATGEVTRVEVVSGAPMGLTEAAIEAVKRWTYRPARVDGQPVSVFKTVRVRFSLTETAPAAEEPPL